jgi:release factor glutamine methyltransferase
MTLSIADAILQATQVLANSGVPEARREAGSLLTHVMNKDRTFLISHSEDVLSDREFSDFRDGIERRAKGEPLQYIIGSQDFFGLEFKVTPDVLIPRPETELLVESALELVGNANPLICDVGTGSGCIAVALLHEANGAHAVALDISEAAIRVAKDNALRNSVADRISFMVSDCFQAFVARVKPFDLIVSNPPYVSDEAIQGLQREVRNYEPHLALTPGGDGLSIIRRLLNEAPDFLKPKGHLLIEIGFDQAQTVQGLIDSSRLKLLDIHPDLQGIPRIAALQKVGH